MKLCFDQLGIENGDIPDERISASSYRSRNGLDFVAALGRLNGDSFWSTFNSDVEPWIQADIGYETYLSGVITQGCGADFPCYITSFKASTSNETHSDMEFVHDPNTGQPKVFLICCIVLYKDLKKLLNVACFYTPVFLKLLIIVQMCKKSKGGNFITIILTPYLSQLVKNWLFYGNSKYPFPLLQ